MRGATRQRSCLQSWGFLVAAAGLMLTVMYVSSKALLDDGGNQAGPSTTQAAKPAKATPQPTLDQPDKLAQHSENLAGEVSDGTAAKSAHAASAQTAAAADGMWSFQHHAIHPLVSHEKLFEPGDPPVTYAPPFAKPPIPTGTPPPGRMVSESDEGWYSPVIPIVHMKSMRRLGRCAAIGSVSSLKGRGLGAEIDAHDVVIRVNDVVNYSADSGSRTDVYFTTMCHLTLRNHELGTYGLKDGPTCDYLCGSQDSHSHQSCPFRALVLAGLNASDCTAAINNKGFKGIQLIERRACYPTGYVNDLWSTEIQVIRRQLRKFNGRPTTGFHAVIVFGYLCDTLTLYGFGLPVKGHSVQRVHAPEKERFLLHSIVNGTLPDEEYPPILRTTLQRKAKAGTIRFAFTS